MSTIEEIKKLDKDGKSYKNLVALAGEICSLKFQTNKEVVLRGEALAVDLASLIGQFKAILLQSGIGNFCQMGDDEIFEKIISPLDAFVLKKNV